MKKAFDISVAMAVMLMLLTMVSCDRVQGALDNAKTKFHKGVTSDSVTVKVIPVANSELTGVLSYVGTVESTKTSVVTSPASGTVTAVYVREGQRLKAGDKVLKIDSQTLQSAYSIAKASLEQAEDGMVRLQKLYDSGSVSEVKMVEMKTNLEKARASERAAAKAMEDCEVKAPFSGVVEGLGVSQGESIDLTTIILRLVDASALEIKFPLPENEYQSVSIGDVAKVRVPAVGCEFEARVKSKGAVASSLSHSYICTLGGFRESAGMMPGMVCKVSVRHGDGCGTVVPSSSVMTDMNGRYVWIVRDGVVAKTYITVGGYSGKGIIVSDGLLEGDAVVVEGARKVSTGMAVKTVE